MSNKNKHSESYCHRCNGPNFVWVAPSPLWNKVMRDDDINSKEKYNGIVCPTCFAVLCLEQGVAESFRFYPTVLNKSLKFVTPSGRIWDSKKWMWVEK